MPTVNPPPTLPPAYVEGFHTSGFGFTGDHYLYPGRCRSDDNTMDITLSNRVIVGFTPGAANGLDTGVHATLTWYAVWVIADDTGALATAGLMSLSPTAPVLPTGYTKKRRVGFILTGRFLLMRGWGGATSLVSSRLGNFREYLVNAYYGESNWRVLTGGTATVATNVSLAALVPSQSSMLRRVTLLSVITTTDLNDAVYYTIPGASATSPYRHVAGDSAAGTMTSTLVFDMIITDLCEVEYKCVPAAGGAISVNLTVLGFTDEV